jgi:hypothetical protein
LGKPDTLVKPHPLTQALGRTRTKRHDWYPALFHAAIDADVLTDIRAACQTGTPLGKDVNNLRLFLVVFSATRLLPSLPVEDDAKT